MHESTTIRVAVSTRDAVRTLADADGVTLDEAVKRLARAERQRRMGLALATTVPSSDDEQWLGLSVRTVAEHARR